MLGDSTHTAGPASAELQKQSALDQLTAIDERSQRAVIATGTARADAFGPPGLPAVDADSGMPRATIRHGNGPVIAADEIGDPPGHQPVKVNVKALTPAAALAGKAELDPAGPEPVKINIKVLTPAMATLAAKGRVNSPDPEPVKINLKALGAEAYARNQFAPVKVETGSIELATVQNLAPPSPDSSKGAALEKVAKSGAASIEAEAAASHVPGGDTAFGAVAGGDEPAAEKPGHFARFKAALSAVVDRVSEVASRAADAFRRLTGSAPARAEPATLQANIEAVAPSREPASDPPSRDTAHGMTRDDRPGPAISHPEVLEAIRSAHANDRDPGPSRAANAGYTR
jgi:hypothetical protein